MNKTRRAYSRILILMTALFAVVAACSGCGDNLEESAANLDIKVFLPSSIAVEQGQDVLIYFTAGKGPLQTDVVVLKQSGKEITCAIKHLTANNFSFSLPEDIQNGGEYEFCIRRKDNTASFGKTVFNIFEKVNPDLKPEDWASVYGVVHCGGVGIRGVVVTDGYNLVTTDNQGVYQLMSTKKNSMVYISIPSGYMPARNGVQTMFWKKLSSPSYITERVDFELVNDGDQTSHTMLFFGDMHLANRTNDRTQFVKFTTEVKSFLGSHGSDKIYATTLGDMTWDMYWYSTKYDLPYYVTDVSAGLGSLTMFHTIGNHDHDMKTSVNGTSAGWDAVDWDTATAFRNNLGPNYYSFNIGKVHYVVVDNIYNKNTTGGQSDDRHYEEAVSRDNLAWLKEDLKFVDKSTPIIVAMHSPLYNQNGSYALTNSSELISCFSGFSSVRFVTGHSHKIWNVNAGAISENNSGSICGAWWWSGYYCPTLNVAQDGSPSGYRVMNFNGKEYTSYFKAIGRADDYQFRSYDRNSIKFDTNIKYGAEFKADLASHGGYDVENRANQVLINVWDWDPTWKVEATENGKALTVTRAGGYDPMYHLVYSANRYQSTDSPNFKISSTTHLFSTTASSATSTIEIKVTDDEGRVYTETMTRPKAFTIDTYK